MLRDIIKKIITSKKRKLFLKNAVIGSDIVFSASSYCRNAGNKNNVKLGNHGCCFAIFHAVFGGKIEIGNNFFIGSNTCIHAKEYVFIGDNVIISNNVLITDNNNHPTSPTKRMEMSKCENYQTDPLWSWENADSAPIYISDNVWIGRDTVILKGVTIGKGSIVGLRAVVTHDVPPYSVVAGNPARVVKKLKVEEDES